MSTAAGVDLLEFLEVRGSRGELEELVEDVHGHALTLNLLGRFLVRAHGGDVRRRDRVNLSKADRDRHASHVMTAYEKWFAEGGEDGMRQLAILRLLGLFDRPADPELLGVLRQLPVIEGLTEPLVGLEADDWNIAVTDLVAGGLVAPSTPAAGETAVLDVHPLVREHFGHRLREEQPEAWKAAHGRLFDHLKDTTEHWPDTLAGLQPLYQAVVHGCLAGRQQEAHADVYGERILRGTKHGGFYSTRILGAFGADLGAVACFFETPWSRLSPSLSEEDHAWFLEVAAFNLRALGRLTEAVELTRASMEMDVERKQWQGAAISASNLSELELTLGDVAAAEGDAERSVEYADRSGEWDQKMKRRTTLADALHQAGRRDDALARFREVESMQTERQPQYPLLYSLRGFQYCDLLLGDAERAAAGGERVAGIVDVCRDVERRASQTLAWVTTQHWLLDIALDHLTLGRARLYRAILEGSAPDDAVVEIEQAVDGLRRAGTVHHVPRGLLTLAWLRSVQGAADAARAALDEAEEIAERGPMPLHLADVALYRARLFHDGAALAETRRLMEEHGYWRRRGEIEDLEGVAAGWGDASGDLGGNPP